MKKKDIIELQRHKITKINLNLIKITDHIIDLDLEDEINSGEVITQDSLFEIMKNKIYRSKFKETILQTKCFLLTFVNIFLQTSKLFSLRFLYERNVFLLIKRRKRA